MKNGELLSRSFQDFWSKRGKVVLLLTAVAALLTILSILAGWVSSSWDWVESRQPAKDRKNLQSISAGLLLSEVSSRLDSKPKTIVKEFSVHDYDGNDIPVKDYMYVLDTAYFEAFVDSDSKVRAYAITMRDESSVADLNSVWPDMTLGKNVISAVAAQSSTSFLYGACGAHTQYLLLISGNSAAQGYQRVAFGYNDAGYDNYGLAAKQCPGKVLDALLTEKSIGGSTWGPVAAGNKSPASPLYSGPLQDADELYTVTDNSMAALSETDLVMNTVIVTASGIEFSPHMKIHPDEISVR